MEGSQRKGLGFVALLIIAAGGFTLLVAVYQAAGNIVVLETWKPVEAQLTDVKIRNDKIYTSSQSARADNYLVTWTFRYNVGGIVHSSTTDPGTHGNYSQMLKWAHQFQNGQTVRIHFLPDNPDVISAAQWTWITFSHAAWVGTWGLGIIVLGMMLRLFSKRITFYAYTKH